MTFTFKPSLIKVFTFIRMLLRSGLILSLIFLYASSFKISFTKVIVTHSHAISHHHDETQTSNPSNNSDESTSAHTHSHMISINASPAHAAPLQASIILKEFISNSFAIAKEQTPPQDPTHGSIFRPPITA